MFPPYQFERQGDFALLKYSGIRRSFSFHLGLNNIESFRPRGKWMLVLKWMTMLEIPANTVAALTLPSVGKKCSWETAAVWIRSCYGCVSPLCFVLPL